MKSDYGNNKMACTLINFVLTRPKSALLAALAAVLILLPGIQHFKADFSYRIWFRETDPGLVRFDAFERKFGNDESSAIAVHSPSGIFDKDSAQLLVDLTQDLWQVPEVIRVDGLANFNWVHAEGDDILVERMLPDDEPLTPELLASRKEAALKHETLPGYLISRDGKTSLIFTHLKPSFEGSPNYAAITNGIRKILKKYEDRGDHEFHITGAAAISQAFDESTQEDMKRLIPIVIGLTVGLLLLIFRTVGGVVLPLVVIVATILLTISAAGWAGIPFTSMTSIIPQILIAIGIADAVHILATFFRARAAGIEQRAAAKLSLDKNFIPTILTSASTAIGFFSFGTSELIPLAHLGVLSGIGALLAWVITYLIVGPMMVLVPMKGKSIGKPAKASEPSAIGIKAAEFLFIFRKPIVIGFFFLTVTAAIYGAGNIVNSDPFKYFTDDYWLTRANTFVEKHVGGAAGPEIILDSGTEEGVKDPEFLKKVEAFQEWLEAKPYVTKTVSIVDVLKQVNRSLHGDKPEYYRIPESREAVAQELFLYTMSLPQGMGINDRVTTTNDALRLTALWTLHDSATVLATMPKLQEKAAEFGLNAEFTGKMVLWQGMNPMIVRSFFISVVLAITLVSALLIWAFGSLRLGAIALIPNLVPLIFGAAILRLIGQPLDIGTVLVASVCLGIAVDDTIHFLSNFNRLTGEGHTRQEAVARIITHTGPALAITTLVLVGAFGTFALATFVPNVNFGILVALVLTAALLTDLIFLPAFLMLIDCGTGKQGEDNNKKAAQEVTTPR
jgi:predicted RND superfamily exporter protein